MAAVRLYDVLLGVCAVGAVLGFLAWRAPRLKRLARVWSWFAFVLACLAWVLRWVEAGHWPIFGVWESALSLALAVLAAGALLRRGGSLPAAVASLVAAGVLVHSRGYETAVYALTISERSLVVDLHAAVAWAAFGCLTANAGWAVAALLRREVERPLVLTLQWGFFLHTAMLVTGSLYKFMLFGQAWSFDPIETLGLFTWLAYGTLLHLQQLAGWGGRRLAGWCVALFAVLVVSYRAIVYFPSWSTYHIFDIGLRLHLT